MEITDEEWEAEQRLERIMKAQEDAGIKFQEFVKACQIKSKEK